MITPADLRANELPTQVILPLHPAWPSPKLLYASCSECGTLYVEVMGEAFVCMCKPDGTRCPLRFGPVHLIDRSRR